MLLKKYQFGNKSETLLRIQSQTKLSKVLDQLVCEKNEWDDHPNKVLNRINERFNKTKLIFRSCSTDEDNLDTSNAGVFNSVLDVDSSDTTAVISAITDVFKSYENRASQGSVLIQPFLTHVSMSGVVLTCDLFTGAPYYTINYDDTSGTTNSVTSGNFDNTETTVIFKEASRDFDYSNNSLRSLIEACKEIETIFDNEKLNIEFGIDKNNQIYIFQVRPIIIKNKFSEDNVRYLSSSIEEAKNKFKVLQNDTKNLLGDYTLFSGMTDWNPAEIIGKKPNTLAVSLYNSLITDDIWALQRYEFGYRNVRPTKLVHNFCSQPYVDIRASLNSFIPASLPDEMAIKIINAYLNTLRDNPSLHDKIELDLAFTIWIPNFKNEVKNRLCNVDLDDNELDLFEATLKDITSRALMRLDSDIEQIYNLEKNYRAIVQSDLHDIDKIDQLLSDCRLHGTLSFAHAARAGFIAITILRSCVRTKHLSIERMLEFQSSVPTVVSEIQSAISSNMSIDILLEKYGHLRPGTYDINQLAYWENPEFYFYKNAKNETFSAEKEFNFTDLEKVGFEYYLKNLQTSLTLDELIHYIRSGIKAREWTKYQFTKNISAAIDCIIAYGTTELNLSREELGYISYDDIHSIKSGTIDKDDLSNLVRERKRAVKQEQNAKLPIFIGAESDFYGYTQDKSQANYITSISKIAELVFVDEIFKKNIDGKIVAIASADPGYDWIFSHDIVGLITKYGGANSHMAIRCAELKIPACIGVGDKLYESLQPGHVILDCQNENIRNV